MIKLKFLLICLISLLVFFEPFAFGKVLEKDFIDAVKRNNADVVDVFITGGANPNARDSAGNSVLMTAVSNGNENIAEILIKNGANVSESYTMGMSVLMLAVNKKMTRTAKLLIQRDADLTVTLPTGENALIIAAEKNLSEIAKDIVEKKQVDINAKTSRGFSALSAAVKNGNIELAKFLNRSGAAPSTILEAVFAGDLNACKKFVENGADIETPDKNGRTPLIIAYAGSNYELAKFLLSKGADINARDGFLLTPALYASMADDGALLSLALARKADVNVQDINGATPLMHEVFRDNGEAVDQILKYDASSVNYVDNNFTTALVIAASKGNIKIAEKLIKSGAYVNMKDSRKPLNAAISSGNYKIADLLLNKGARINAKDINGESSLITAASKNDFEGVRFLVVRGARTNTRDKNGLTPFDYASKYANSEMMKILKTSRGQQITAE